MAAAPPPAGPPPGVPPPTAPAPGKRPGPTQPPVPKTTFNVGEHARCVKSKTTGDTNIFTVTQIIANPGAPHAVLEGLTHDGKTVTYTDDTCVRIPLSPADVNDLQERRRWLKQVRLALDGYKKPDMVDIAAAVQAVDPKLEQRQRSLKTSGEPVAVVRRGDKWVLYDENQDEDDAAQDADLTTLLRQTGHLGVMYNKYLLTGALFLKAGAGSAPVVERDDDVHYRLIKGKIYKGTKDELDKIEADIRARSLGSRFKKAFGSMSGFFKMGSTSTSSPDPAPTPLDPSKFTCRFGMGDVVEFNKQRWTVRGGQVDVKKPAPHPCVVLTLLSIDGKRNVDANADADGNFPGVTLVARKGDAVPPITCDFKSGEVVDYAGRTYWIYSTNAGPNAASCERLVLVNGADNTVVLASAVTKRPGVPIPDIFTTVRIGDTIRYRKPGERSTTEAVVRNKLPGTPNVLVGLVRGLLGDKEQRFESRFCSVLSPTTNPIYFKHQVEPASCGRHAINHMLGKELYMIRDYAAAPPSYKNYLDPKFTSLPDKNQQIDLRVLCAQLEEAYQAKYSAPSPFECQSDENYDLSTLRAALNIAGYRLTGISVIGDKEERKNPETVKEFIRGIGDGSQFLVNVGTPGAKVKHWIVVRKVRANDYILFDSLTSAPVYAKDPNEFVQLSAVVQMFLVQNSLRRIYPFAYWDDMERDKANVGCPFHRGDRVWYSERTWYVHDRRMDGDPPSCISVHLTRGAQNGLSLSPTQFRDAPVLAQTDPSWSTYPDPYDAANAGDTVVCLHPDDYDKPKTEFRLTRKYLKDGKRYFEGEATLDNRKVVALSAVCTVMKKGTIPTPPPQAPVQPTATTTPIGPAAASAPVQSATTTAPTSPASAPAQGPARVVSGNAGTSANNNTFNPFFFLNVNEDATFAAWQAAIDNRKKRLVQYKNLKRNDEGTCNTYLDMISYLIDGHDEQSFVVMRQKYIASLTEAAQNGKVIWPTRPLTDEEFVPFCVASPVEGNTAPPPSATAAVQQPQSAPQPQSQPSTSQAQPIASLTGANAPSTREQMRALDAQLASQVNAKRFTTALNTLGPLQDFENRRATREGRPPQTATITFGAEQLIPRAPTTPIDRTTSGRGRAGPGTRKQQNRFTRMLARKMR